MTVMRVIPGTALGDVTLTFRDIDLIRLEFGGKPHPAPTIFRVAYRGGIILRQGPDGTWAITDAAIYRLDADPCGPDHRPTPAGLKAIKAKAIELVSRWAQTTAFKEARLEVSGATCRHLKATRDKLQAQLADIEKALAHHRGGI